jgi:AcrR family transcriptional regulator
MTTQNQGPSSVWTRPVRKRRDSETLHRDQIVAEAMKLLDEEGLDALSMRRLGARLNAGATSLYWHVANKDELIELVVDEVYGELEIPEIEDPAGWRDAMTRCAQTLRQAILKHPWFVSTFNEIGLSYLGPNLMRMSDRMLAIVEAGGFSLHEGNRVVTVVVAYVMGMALNEASWLSTVKRSGRTEQEWLAAVRPAAEAAAQAYPRLGKLYAEHLSTELEQGREDDFSYGLARLIDGISAPR